MTEEETDARMEGFEEAIEHLGLAVCDTAVERREYTKAAEMIRTLANAWYRKHNMPP
jgi:hypothetical protein